jgi:hypothetical protein
VQFSGAEATAETRKLATVMKAARKDPKWAAWYVAHKHPERWSEQRDEPRKLTRELAELGRLFGKGSPVEAVQPKDERGSPQ